MSRLTTRFPKLAKLVPWLISAAVLALTALAGQPPPLFRRPILMLRKPFVILAPSVAGLLILMQQPALGLAVLAALSFTLPFTFGTGTGVEITPPVFLIAGMAAVWVLTRLFTSSARLPMSRTVLPLLLFVLSGLVSLLAGRAYWDPLVPQPGNLLWVQLGQWGIYALSAAIFVLSADLGQNGRWLELAVWTFLVLATVVVLQFYLPPLGRLLGWSRGDMANRSMFWIWLAALAAGQLFFNHRLRPAARLWLVALLAAAAFVVWFMQRDWASGWAPFSVAFLGVLLLWAWRRNRVLGLVLCTVLVLIAVVLSPKVFAHVGGEKELEMSWGGRAVLYRAVLDVVKGHPILGLGPAAYRAYTATHWLATGFGKALYLQPQVSSHNNYIDIYAQQGLVGVALFLWFLVELCVVGWRLARRVAPDFEDGYVQGALGGLAGSLVAMLLADWFLPFVYNIGFPGFRTSALAWMFLGGLVALEQGVRSHQQVIRDE